MTYDVEAIRKKLKATMTGKYNDPDEFKPEKAKSNTEAIKYRFYILPPIAEGEILKSGPVKRTMENFFVAHANHWINEKPYPCPRVWDHSECPICQCGFDLLKECKDEDRRRAIREQWMPAAYYMVNIFFPNIKQNPEDLRNKVKFYNAPKTCFDLWYAALMRDSKGDAEDPEAYGVFFDERAAFLFELNVLKSGRQNSYKTSKFLANVGPQPMITDKDGKPAIKALEVLLKLRHNLWDKIEIPEHEKIKSIYLSMTDGDDSHNERRGFDEDEQRPAKESQTKASGSPGKTTTTTKKDPEPAATKPVTESQGGEDDIISQLTNQLTDDVKPKPSTNGEPLAAETPLSEAAEKTTQAASNDANSEIDALLSQLEDS